MHHIIINYHIRYGKLLQSTISRIGSSQSQSYVFKTAYKPPLVQHNIEFGIRGGGSHIRTNQKLENSALRLLIC